MEKGFTKVIKDFFYALASNGLTFVLSAVMTLLLPKFLSVEDFGYYQLFIFYLTYASVLALGWPDGIYLKLGGTALEKIEKEKYSAQFRLFCILEFFIYSFVAFGVFSFQGDYNKKIVMILVCISGFLYCGRLFLNYLLQATGNIKNYSRAIIIEKIVFGLLSLFTVIILKKSYVSVLFADILGKFISFVYTIYFCRSIIFSKPCSVKSIYSDIKENIFSGSQLIFASFASMLIVGIAKFEIQGKWSISVFSKVSFAFSISNMLMQLIGAMAIVLFPVLRNVDEHRLPEIYDRFRCILMVFVLGILNFYWLGAGILNIWLPQYNESLKYAIILLPICVYESKNSMLISTYFKTLRMENVLLRINIAAMLISLLLTTVSVYFLESITLAVISILISLIVRAIIGECVLGKKLHIYVYKDIIEELILSLVFIISNWFLGYKGEFVYVLSYVIYILLNRNSIMSCKKYFLKNK